MCLDLAKNYRKRTAEADIRCYKHICIGRNGLVSSYQKSPVVIGETYSSDLKIVKGLRLYSSSDVGDFITDGLHSFKSLKAAINDAKLCGIFDCLGDYDDYKIVECLIPVGSCYYRGRFGDRIAFASDKLTYVRVVGEFKNNKYVTLE